MSDTTRDDRRIWHDATGQNSAGKPDLLGENFITPLPLFFVRSHAATPAIDAAAWRLVIDGLVERPRTFSLDELLSEFPRRTVTCTLLCAGLRRAELTAFGPLPGELPWGTEAVSTGEWSGVSLGDVLRSVGVAAGAAFVELTGLDDVERHGRRFGLGGSIDVTRALSDDVLLATTLNGAPLTPEHGYPVRAVVPGWIGARSVKWLGRITLRTDESPNYFQAEAYRIQHTVNPNDPRDVTAGTPIAEFPVNSAILRPSSGDVVGPGTVRVSGWALGTGGRGLACVELSANGGADWSVVEVMGRGDDATWVLWQADVDLSPGLHTLVVRATDVTGAMQPADLAETWNVKGYCNNAWHRVVVHAR